MRRSQAGLTGGDRYARHGTGVTGVSQVQMEATGQGARGTQVAGVGAVLLADGVWSATGGLSLPEANNWCS